MALSKMYLLNGVLNSKINTKNNEIYVEYDSLLISLKLLKMNILLYLNLKKNYTFV